MRCSSSVRPLRVHEPCPRLIARIRSLWIWASKSPPRISTPAQLVRRSKAGKGVAASQRGCRPCEREPTHGANVTQVHIWGRINAEFLGGRRQAYSPGRRECAPRSSNRIRTEERFSVLEAGDAQEALGVLGLSRESIGSPGCCAARRGRSVALQRDRDSMTELAYPFHVGLPRRDPCRPRWD